MGKINVLSFEIANLIAAGEVVERPASAIKELIENSIDAKSTEIVAEIKRGGVSLIRVTDNGAGISKEDLPIAIKRHATSKIKDKEDLASIMTLGFRGEALAAISSVSDMTIITKTKEADTAYMLTAEAGKVVDLSEVGAADGTTVVVENLFYNVPARRKFLKKDSTEAMNVAALLEKIALSHPEISIQLLVDGEQRFKTPGDGNLLGAIRAIFGKDFADKLIKVSAEADGIRVHGYIGRSDNVRKNRNLENVFVNSRYVKSLTAQAAIEKAYTSYIAPECFPTCVLFVDLNPNFVDVNVHPAKLEVKFSDERRIFEAVYYSVRSALEEGEYRPELKLAKDDAFKKNPLMAFVPIGEDTRGKQIEIKAPTSKPQAPYTAPERPATPKIDMDRPVSFSSRVEKPFKSENNLGSISPSVSSEILKRYAAAAPKEAEPVPADAPIQTTVGAKHYKYVGEAFDCYVIIEYEGDILFIDKHAAHERVIFEDLLSQRKRDTRIASQSLLLPITLILTADELSAVSESRDELVSVGFEFYLGDRGVDITAIPDAIDPSDAEALFTTMADEICSGRGNPAVTEALRRERALYQIACKAAIKGGRKYDKAVIEWLIEKLLELPDITVCPHGRPVAYKLTKSELDRQFNRIK